MHLDRRFLIIVGSSLAWGLVVSLVFYRMALGGRRAAPEKTVVVAAEPLSPGVAITPGVLKMTRVPENLFPKGAYSRMEDVVGRPVISSIGADEPVVDSRLAARGSGFGVAPMIPTGMRAVSVRVNDVAGVAGFVLPGMRVDVLVTGKPPGADDTFTATVLQNVTVLSAGQTIQSDGKSQSMSVPVVTLLVDPLQAESLTLAANEGHIQLVLRNSGDQRVETTARRELRQLYTHGIAIETDLEPRPMPAPIRPAARPEVRAAIPVPAAPAPATAKPEPPPAPAVESIILIRGNLKTVETFPVESKPREGGK
jgi:pilus assembly protein CpaB